VNLGRERKAASVGGLFHSNHGVGADLSPRPFVVVTASVAVRERPIAAGCAFWSIGAGASFWEVHRVVASPELLQYFVKVPRRA
jgi:hypothetical protein